MSNGLQKIEGMPFDTALGQERKSPILDSFLVPFERHVSLDALEQVVDECMRLFSAKATNWETDSDTWLAPRVHASLRLSKREAAIHGVWVYLAAYAFPDYVAWRWGDAVQLTRSVATDVSKHAFRRLWWGAEMFRNGDDYTSATQAFAKSDIPNTLLKTRIMNNRSVALATLRYLKDNNVTSRQVNAVSRQLSTAAVTVALDFACPNYTESLEIDHQWLETEPFGDDVVAFPKGPTSAEATDEDVKRALGMLDLVIDLDRVRKYRR